MSAIIGQLRLEQTKCMSAMYTQAADLLFGAPAKIYRGC